MRLALIRLLDSLSSLVRTMRLIVRWVVVILGLLALLKGRKVARKVMMLLSKLSPNQRLAHGYNILL